MQRTLRYVEHAIGHRFMAFAPAHTVGRVHAPVLLLHGGQDATVPVQDAYALQAHSGGHARLHVVPDADHTSIDALMQVGPVLSLFFEMPG